jgi:hypothetical protein
MNDDLKTKALREARAALTGWMDQPDTSEAYDSALQRAIDAVAAIDRALGGEN